MNSLVRKSAFVAPVKRGIMVTAHQDNMVQASDLLLKKTNSSVEDAIKTPQLQTVKDLRMKINAPYVPLYTSKASSVRTEITLDEDKALEGKVIRGWIINNETDKLWDVLNRITMAKNPTVLTHLLMRDEITILLQKLCESQIKQASMISEYTGLKAKHEFKQKKRVSEMKCKQISQVMTALSRIPGFELSGFEVDLILNLLMTYKEFNKASLWLVSIADTVNGMEINELAPRIKSFTPSLNYQNYKMEIMGETTPLKWEFPRDTHINWKHYKSNPIKTEHWGTLIHEFPKSQYIINLKTHIELLSGVSRHGNLEQVKDYIHQTWGISPNGTAPKYLVDRTSPIYPNHELLQRIITIFGYHDKLNEVLEYLNSFDRYYDVSLDKHNIVWKNLIKQLKNSGAKDEDVATAFSSIWKLMKHKEVNINATLYRLRLQILKDSEFELELVNDIPEIWKKYEIQSSYEAATWIESLISDYLETIIAILYKNDIESDKSVLMLLSKYTLNEVQLNSLVQKSKILKKQAVANKKKFEQLQEQYDQEDEEDALW